MRPNGCVRGAAEASRVTAVLPLDGETRPDAARAPAPSNGVRGRVNGDRHDAEREMTTTREDVTDPMGATPSDTSPGLGPLEPAEHAMGLVPASFPSDESPTRPRRPASGRPGAPRREDEEALVDDLIEGLRGAEPWHPEKKSTRETSGDAYAAHHSIARAPMRKPTPMPEAKVVLHVTAEHPVGARPPKRPEPEPIAAARRAPTFKIEGAANETVLTEATTSRRRVGVASLLVAGALLAAAAMIALAALRAARSPARSGTDRAAVPASSLSTAAPVAPDAIASGQARSVAAPPASSATPAVATSLARSAKSASEAPAPASSPRPSSAAPRDPDSELFETKRTR